jgi:hypothetical protein
MRLSIIRLICLRDLRDQLRDRRTVVMIALLPLVLYPILGIAVMQFAVGFAAKPSKIGIIGRGPDFPPRQETRGHLLAVPAATWLALAPSGPGLRLDQLLGTAALIQTSQKRPTENPLLVIHGAMPPEFAGESVSAPGGKVVFLPGMHQVEFLDQAGRFA